MASQYHTSGKMHPTVTVVPSQYLPGLLQVHGTNGWHLGTLEPRTDGTVDAELACHPQPVLLGRYSTLEAAVDSLALHAGAEA